MNANTLDALDEFPARPTVLLAMVDQYARAGKGYALSAAGFDVVMPDLTGTAFSTLRPDVVLIDLSDPGDDANRGAQRFIRDWPRDVPIVGIVPDVGYQSCEFARRQGCAAVCLATCPVDELAAGLRAVLERHRELAAVRQIS